MNKLNALKSVAGIITSIGAGAVVGNAIKATTPADIKVLNQVLIGVGGFVLSSMVGDAASDYAEKTIDDAFISLKTSMDSSDNN